MNPRVGTNPLLCRVTVIDDETGAPETRIINSGSVTSVTVTEPDRTEVPITVYEVEVAASAVRFNHALTKAGVYSIQFGLLLDGAAAPSSKFRFTVDP